MLISLLKPGYKKNEAFYQAFLAGDLYTSGQEYIDETLSVRIEEAPDFPVYLGKGKGEEKNALFLELVHTLERGFAQMERQNLLSELFWHSYLCIYKRNFLLENYPQIKESRKNFENIVTKDFDWENYIYKGVLAVQYVNEHVSEEKREGMYQLILDNFDVFNYIIKYEIFRNGAFLVNLLEIMAENNLEAIFKAKIKNRPDLGKDERYGRRVIYEFNKSYPIVLSPMLTKEQLTPYVLQFLSYYYQGEMAIDAE